MKVLAGSLLIAISAQISISVLPVPITGQTFGVLLTGAAFGSRLGTLAVLAYMLEGFAGMPVFAPGGAVGIARLLGPSGGYLLGFLPAAYVVGWLSERGWDRSVTTTVLSMVIGNFVIYIFGLLGLSRFVPIDNLLAAGLLPFLAGDGVKVALAAIALPSAWWLTDRLQGR
jgi:biotin transport system substrate-specific component